MEKIFNTVLEMSVTAGYVILAVMFVRLLMKRMPKKYSYALWSVVGFRLACPISFKSVFSLFSVTAKGAGTADRMIMASNTYDLPLSQTVIDVQNIDISAPKKGGAATNIFLIIWLIGIGIMLIYAVASYLKLYRRMRTATRLQDNIYESDRVRSPFVLGFVQPKIYIPFGLDEKTLKYVLAHERYHIRRFDNDVKPMAFLLLTLHWFNPLCWIAFYLMSKDMEMSCDEWVLSTENDIRKAYSMSLLSFAANRRFLSAGLLAFGETDVKSRIKHALNWKKPTIWISVAAMIICIAVVVACATDPVEKTDEQNPQETERTAEIDYSTDDVQQHAIKDEPNDTDLSSTQTLTKLRDSVRLSNDSVFFTVPSDYGDVESLNIHIAGRGSSDGFTYSVHFFEGEQWIPGKEYEIPLDGIVELNMDAWLGDESITVDMLCGMITDEMIESLFNDIMSSPALSSSAADYINEHPEEYNKLIGYGDYTLKYIFKTFLKGGQTDLRGFLMMSIMENLIGDEAIAYDAQTGQEYFDVWHEHVKRELDKNDEAFMEKYCPKGLILLRMAGEC